MPVDSVRSEEGYGRPIVLLFLRKEARFAVGVLHGGKAYIQAQLGIAIVHKGKLRLLMTPRALPLLTGLNLKGLEKAAGVQL